MKRFICCLIVIILILTGCSPSGYQLINENGNYYILYEGQPEPTNPNDLVCEPAPAIYFSSMKEMKSDIQKGKFTEEELKELSRFTHRDERGAIVICNLDDLYQPIYPSDLDLTVVWRGPKYHWAFREGDSYRGLFTAEPRDEDIFTERENPETYWVPNNSVTYVSDRNATVINYAGYGDHTSEIICYRIEAEDKILLVEEFHDLTVNTYEVNIYGKQGDQYFYISFLDPPERPSVEWLSQFGIQKYV